MPKIEINEIIDSQHQHGPLEVGRVVDAVRDGLNPDCYHYEGAGGRKWRFFHGSTCTVMPEDQACDIPIRITQLNVDSVYQGRKLVEGDMVTATRKVQWPGLRMTAYIIRLDDGSYHYFWERQSCELINGDNG